MKKKLLLLLVLSVFCSVPVFAEDSDTAQPPAEEMQPDQMPPQGQQQSGQAMMGGGMGTMGGRGMMGGHGMKGMMERPTMIATDDGGVIVLFGGKLAKYDNQLVLVNEVELKGAPKQNPSTA